MRFFPIAASVVLVCISGCGSGADQSRHFGSPVDPSPVATRTAGQEPPLPFAAPVTSCRETTPDVADIILGAAIRFVEDLPSNDVELTATPLLIRHDGNAWSEEQLAPPLGAPGSVNGVTFSTPTTAWVTGGIGTRGDARPLLQRSDDAGLTWTDVSDLIQVRGRLRGAHGPVFSSADTRWLFLGSSITFAALSSDDFIWRTTDGGVSWRPVADCLYVQFCEEEALCLSRNTLDTPISLGAARGARIARPGLRPPGREART